MILNECGKVKGLVDKVFQVVPGGGFEPPTRGFSVLCSTPELQRKSTTYLFSTNCATLLSQRETKLVGIRKEIKTYYRNILACTFP